MAKKKNATNRIIWIIIGFVIILVILGVVGSATGFLGQRDNSITVETTTVDIRSITQLVTASGRVQPEIEVRISPDVSGEIIALPIKEGDWVEQGTLLSRIKPDFYEAQVEQAQAGVLQSKANQAQRRADLLNSESELKRQEELFNKNIISESDYERAVNTREVAQAGYEAAMYAVQSAEARLSESREQLAKTIIYAPMNGTISQLNIEPGERVVGTTQMTGTEMMRIAKLDQMELEVDVNENDVVNVALGDTSSIEIDAYPERIFRGVVTEIANSARVTGAGSQEQVTNFPVKVRIQDLHNVDSVGPSTRSAGVGAEEVPAIAEEIPNFRPGMSGTVDIYTKTINNAIVVPIQAVTVRDFNALETDNQDDEMEVTEAVSSDETSSEADEEDLRKVVFIVVDGKAHMVEVETGITDETHIEIKMGLIGGEEVIIGPYRAVSRDLEPDTSVKVEEEENNTRRTVIADSQ